MKERITKLCNVRNLMILFVLIYVLSLIPLIMISPYNFPSADDYSNGSASYHLWNETHSVGLVLKDAAVRMMKEYDKWRGCYTSSYLSAIPPCIWGQKWTFLTPIVGLLLITFSVLFFVDQLVGKVLKADRRIGVCVSMVILFACIQCLPSVARCELLYWYSGACNYAYIHALALIFYGCLIATASHSGKRRILDMILACIAGVLAAGGNQMSALNGAIIIVTIAIFITWKKKWKQYRILLVPMALYLSGFIVSMASPGDWVRMESTTMMGPVKAILVSLYYTYSRAVNEWTTWSVILLELLLVPFFWLLAKQIRLKLRYPLLVIAYGYGIVSAMMTPPLFAVANIEAGRIQGLTYWMYILVLTLCVGYTVIWGYQKLNGVSVEDTVPEGEGSFSFDSSCFLLGCMAFFVFGAGLTLLPDSYYFTATSALQDLANGKAEGFTEEMQQRLDIYEQGTGETVMVYELQNQPELLFFSDIKPDHEDWENKAVARYFDLQDVIWLPQENKE